MQSASRNPQRIPTLDGWRGVAILLVLIEHFSPFRNGKPFRPWLEMGQHGVSIFFVLSGFLITTLLLREQETTGSIDLRGFYLRRIFRLMPSAWAYLLTVCAVLLLAGSRIHGDMPASVFFYRNQWGITYISDYLTMHFWSLSIEEQFYLVWPLALTTLGARRAAWGAAIGSILVAAFRLAHWGMYAVFPMKLHTVVRADALLLGCLAALLCNHSTVRNSLQWLRHSWPLFALAFGYFVVRYQSLTPFNESLLLAVWIATTSYSVSWFSRLLDGRWISILGRHAYSIYVWQQIFSQLISHQLWLLPLVLLLVPISAASYRFLELPFTRMGHRLTRSNPAIPPEPFAT